MYVLKIVRYMLDEVYTGLQTVERYRVCDSEKTLLRVVQEEILWASEELPISCEQEIVELWYSWLTGGAKELVTAWNNFCSDIVFQIIEVREERETEELDIPSAIVPFSRCEDEYVCCVSWSIDGFDLVCQPGPHNAYADTLLSYNMFRVWD